MLRHVLRCSAGEQTRRSLVEEMRSDVFVGRTRGAVGRHRSKLYYAIETSKRHVARMCCALVFSGWAVVAVLTVILLYCAYISGSASL